MVSPIAGSRGSPPRPWTAGGGADSAEAAMASSCAGAWPSDSPPAQAPRAATTSGSSAHRAALEEVYAFIVTLFVIVGCVSLQPDLEGGRELREEGADHRELPREEEHTDQQHHGPGSALQREHPAPHLRGAGQEPVECHRGDEEGDAEA